MKYVILTNMYPKEESLYRNAFIHRRVLEYIKHQLDVEVFVLDNNKNTPYKYTFEGVDVHEGSKQNFIDYINSDVPKKILIHFIDRSMMESLELIDKDTPIIIWIHLMEAIAWYRRLFSIRDKGFLKYILQNTRQLINLRNFIKNSKNRNVEYIFVSNWIKNAVERDTRTNFEKYHIIHNVIDTNLFKYRMKDVSTRKKILLIRPFESRKYANDIAVDAIVKLSKKDFFTDLEFSIYGSGALFDKTVKPLIGLPNVKIYNKYLKHNEIMEEHYKHGVFLCPTRQDSQGVSMCEAMSSGLIPITTDNSAIPEFVENNKTGILTNSSKEIADGIEYLYYNPSDFNEISKQASKFISDKCSPEIVIKQELEVILG